MIGRRLKLLSPDEARRTLVHRLAPTVDRLRQRLVNFGLRPYQVHLVWVGWSGLARGEGYARVVRRLPLLPIPEVQDLTGIALNLFSAGALPIGTVKVTGISALYPQDLLTGKVMPCDPQAVKRAILEHGRAPNPTALAVELEEVPQPYEFAWEVVEDGRANEGRQPQRARFRVMSDPFHRPDKFDWAILLERVSDDLERDGTSSMARPR